MLTCQYKLFINSEQKVFVIMFDSLMSKKLSNYDQLIQWIQVRWANSDCNNISILQQVRSHFKAYKVLSSSLEKKKFKLCTIFYQELQKCVCQHERDSFFWFRSQVADERLDPGCQRHCTLLDRHRHHTQGYWTIS